jgi:hypothetical protein
MTFTQIEGYICRAVDCGRDRLCSLYQCIRSGTAFWSVPALAGNNSFRTRPPLLALEISFSAIFVAPNIANPERSSLIGVLGLRGAGARL